MAALEALDGWDGERAIKYPFDWSKSTRRVGGREEDGKGNGKEGWLELNLHALFLIVLGVGTFIFQTTENQKTWRTHCPFSVATIICTVSISH